MDENSKEYKTAKELGLAVNGNWSCKRFAQAVTTSMHRTLQQELMRTFVAVIREMASDEYKYDQRNEACHKAAVSMVQSGILDDIHLPFI